MLFQVTVSYGNWVLVEADEAYVDGGVLVFIKKNGTDPQIKAQFKEWQYYRLDSRPIVSDPNADVSIPS